MQHAVPIERLASGAIATAATVSGEAGGFTLEVEPCAPPDLDSPIVADVGSVWDLERFATPRAPFVVGTLEDRGAFSIGGDLHVADLPIKFPGTELRIPHELAAFAEVVRRAVACELAINERFGDYYLYLTAQRTDVVDGEINRGAGVHSDSVQGPRIEPKRPIERGYSCTDVAPTRYFTHGFDLSDVDVASHYLNAAFEQQADATETFRGGTYDIVCFDAYCVHSAVPAPAGRRTFVRIIASVREFDRIGNTHNALFDYGWDMVPRPLPDGLIGRSELVGGGRL